MIPPGQTLGLLGGRPAARMLAVAAQTLGYRVHVFDPAGSASAAGVAHRVVRASYDDVAALKEFAREVDLVLVTYEDIPIDSLRAIVGLVPLHPAVEVLEITQQRQREKAWLRTNGFPHVRYAEALDGDIASVIAQVGRPCVVKSADFDREGRSQMKITTDAELEQAAAIFRGRRCILERWVDFSCELSVIVARTAAGAVTTFPVAENIHRRQLLDISIVPARVSAAIARDAVQLAVAMAGKLAIVGLLAAEVFVLPSGEVLINEFVPHPHEGGHWSLDGCETSQFDQYIRAICGLPLGAVDVREPSVMVNILGEAWGWRDGRATIPPDWTAVLASPRTRLHHYGLIPARPGQRMGHFTVRDTNIEDAIVRARELKMKLLRLA